MGKNTTTNNATTNTTTENTTSPFTFAEKVQRANVALESLRISVDIAKLERNIEKLDKKDELTSEEILRKTELEEKLHITRVTFAKYTEAFGNVSISECLEDKFAFVCAWCMNPQKGESHKEKGGSTEHFDISFEGMYKVVSAIKGYYKNFFDKADSKEKTEAKKELATILSDFVNARVPHEKNDILLSPCKDKTVTLTMCKLDKEYKELITKSFGIPKNCMENGYKPMTIKFIDTDEKPMIKELVSTVSGRYKWGERGIERTKVDEYAIIHEVFLTALKYSLEFDTSKVKTVTCSYMI